MVDPCYGAARERGGARALVSGVESERYWDARARENALFFVDTEVDYDDPDTEAFWRRGEEVVARMLEIAGLSIEPHEAVLDIGCGVGRLTRALASRAHRVCGLDVSRRSTTPPCPTWSGCTATGKA